VSPFRPDIVAVWIFRAAEDGLPASILLIRRAPGRLLPGLWQCVTGGVEADERVTEAALREVQEETGLGPADIEAFYDLDQVTLFHEPSADAVLSEAVFAIRVGAAAEAVISHEHDDLRWVTPEDAAAIAVWPAYRESIGRIRDLLGDPERARWLELDLDGQRLIR
jgi:8-oxo-dGTP pyrophosphatase MutT (NUDIX family)